MVGRDEPKAQTFRNYLASLNRAMPPGTMVKEGLHHSLADTITSDWARFCALVALDKDRAQNLAEALTLLRGAPFEAALSGRNSPYAWAGDLIHHIEVAVEKAGHELATLGLASGDLAPADAGTSRVLRCLPESLVAREDHLRLGSAIGGPPELRRRMRILDQGFPDESELLEPLARSLGWEGS